MKKISYLGIRLKYVKTHLLRPLTSVSKNRTQKLLQDEFHRHSFAIIY